MTWSSNRPITKQQLWLHWTFKRLRHGFHVTTHCDTRERCDVEERRWRLWAEGRDLVQRRLRPVATLMSNYRLASAPFPLMYNQLFTAVSYTWSCRHFPCILTWNVTMFFSGSRHCCCSLPTSVDILASHCENEFIKAEKVWSAFVGFNTRTRLSSCDLFRLSWASDSWLA